MLWIFTVLDTTKLVWFLSTISKETWFRFAPHSAFHSSTYALTAEVSGLFHVANKESSLCGRIFRKGTGFIPENYTKSTCIYNWYTWNAKLHKMAFIIITWILAWQRALCLYAVTTSLSVHRHFCRVGFPCFIPGCQVDLPDLCMDLEKAVLLICDTHSFLLLWEFSHEWYSIRHIHAVGTELQRWLRGKCGTWLWARELPKCNSSNI